MIKLLVSVMALETERLRLSFSRLSLFPGRVQQPKRQVGRRPVGLCVCRLGLPARRQVEPGFDSGLTAQIRLSFCHLEAASRAELFRLLHQPPELLRVAHPVFLCALFRALPGVAKPERLLAQSLASPCRLA